MHNKQAGGIVSFIVVAIALTGLLVGGLYLSKLQGRVARETDTSKPQVSTVQNNENKSQNTAKPNASKPAEKPAEQNQSPGSSQATPQTPTPTTGPSTPTDRVANTGPSETVPSTGPAETVTSMLMLAALVFTSYRLIQSRRTFLRAALRR